MVKSILRLSVSEPWDFHSSDGDNVLIVETVKSLDDNKKIVKCLSTFDGMSDYLILTPRNSSHAYNVYKLEEFDDDKTVFTAGLFIMIVSEEDLL